MNVCILTHTFPRNKKDVAAAFMKEFSDGLTQAGNKVCVVTPYDKEFKRTGDPFKIYTYKYIWPDSFHVLGYSRSMQADISLKKKTYFLLPFLIFFGIIKLLAVVKKEKIELINTHWILPNGLIAVIVSKITKVPYVITLPGTDAYLAYRYKLFGKVAKWIANNSSGITSNSSWHLKRILNLGANCQLTKVISYPVDVSRFKPAKTGLVKLRKKFSLAPTDLIILAIGRLVYKKGFSYLVKAMVSVTKKYPGAKLLIGGDGDLKDELEKLSIKLSLENSVIFLGIIRRDDIARYYNLADVMVVPSIVDKRGNVDGGPLVSFESMACAKPQVVTNVLGVADIVDKQFVVPQKSKQALANAIGKLLNSKKLRIRVGKESRKRITRNLTTKKIGEEYTKFFKKVGI